MNIKKALQTIEAKSRQGEDVTEDLQSLIEALDLEDPIRKEQPEPTQVREALLPTIENIENTEDAELDSSDINSPAK